MLSRIAGLPVMAVFITSKTPIDKGIVGRLCKSRQSAANDNPWRPCPHTPMGRLAALHRYHVPLTHNRRVCHFYGRSFVESLEQITITPSGGLLVTSVLKKIPYAVLIPLTVLRNG
jgi:hypothetical protein